MATLSKCLSRLLLSLLSARRIHDLSKRQVAMLAPDEVLPRRQVAAFRQPFSAELLAMRSGALTSSTRGVAR